MDGTLVEPCIDFADMRRRVYEIASEDWGREVTGGDVIEMEQQLSPAAREKVQVVFADIEAKALRDMTLRQGMVELCQYLDSMSIRRAVLTRNVETSVRYMMTEKMVDVPPFVPVVARDTINTCTNTVIAAKPQPDAIHYICQQWNCDPSHVMMVGDSELDDMVAANRAGCGASILLQTNEDNNSGNDEQSNAVERQPSLVVESLAELEGILKSVMVLN